MLHVNLTACPSLSERPGHLEDRKACRAGVLAVKRALGGAVKRGMGKGWSRQTDVPEPTAKGLAGRYMGLGILDASLLERGAERREKSITSFVKAEATDANADR